LVNKSKKVGKEDVVQWVFLFIKNALISLNIDKAFKTTKIWPLKPTTMKCKMQPNEQFMEIKTYEPIGEAFDLKMKCTSSIKPTTCHYYVEIDG
jgi:hypothetical protein